MVALPGVFAGVARVLLVAIGWLFACGIWSSWAAWRVGGWGWCVAWGWFGDRAGGVVRIGWVRIGVIASGAVRPGTMWNCSPIIAVVRFV